MKKVQINNHNFLITNFPLALLNLLGLLLLL